MATCRLSPAEVARVSKRRDPIDELLNRAPPSDLPAERAVLGSILLVPALLETVHLSPDDFLDQAHRKLFAAMLALQQEGKPIDGVLLARRLADEADANWPSLVAELLRNCPTGMHAAHYAAQVREKATKRMIYLRSLDCVRYSMNGVKVQDLISQVQTIADCATTSHDTTLSLVDTASLADKPLTLAPTIFDGLLRVGETMNLIMVTKAGKSWFAKYMAICLRLGTDLFDLFPVTPGEVLYVNAEIQKATFEHRIKTVVEALGFRLADLKGLHLLHLKGRMMDLDALFARLRQQPPGKFSVVILDPLSRLYPKGMKEGDPESMAEIYNKIDAFNEHHGCACIVVHHGTKGSQTNKGVTDVGSGTGMISRAADAHIIGRAHEEPGAVVIDAALRSFAPIDPFCLRWSFPLWRLDEGLDPTRLKPDRPSKPKAAEKEPEAITPWTAERFAAEFVKDEPRKKDVIVTNAAEKLTARAAERWLAVAEDRGLVHRWKLPGSNAAHYANRPQINPQSEIT